MTATAEAVVCHVLTRWAWYAWPGSYPACYTALRQRVRRLNYVRYIEVCLVVVFARCCDYSKINLWSQYRKWWQNERVAITRHLSFWMLIFCERTCSDKRFSIEQPIRKGSLPRTFLFAGGWGRSLNKQKNTPEPLCGSCDFSCLWVHKHCLQVANDVFECRFLHLKCTYGIFRLY